MIVALIGPSGAGKSVIAKGMAENFSCKEIIIHTTREPRPGENDGKDYYFVSQGEFDFMIENNEFAEFAEYTYGRKYGTSFHAVKEAAESNDLYVIALTPGGLRNIKKAVGEDRVMSVFINADIGVRATRYINRIGVHQFTHEDLSELNNRANKDFGMFLGVEKEVDFVLDNNGDKDIVELATLVFTAAGKWWKTT